MKTERALRLIRRLKAAEAEISGWEGEFLDGVETRLGAYGRAFADPRKGRRDHALSVLQQRKLKEIRAKLSGEPQASDGHPDAGRKGGFIRRKPFGAPRRTVGREDGETE